MRFVASSCVKLRQVALIGVSWSQKSPNLASSWGLSGATRPWRTSANMLGGGGRMSSDTAAPPAVGAAGGAVPGLRTIGLTPPVLARCPCPREQKGHHMGYSTAPIAGAVFHVRYYG